MGFWGPRELLDSATVICFILFFNPPFLLCVSGWWLGGGNGGDECSSSSLLGGLHDMTSYLLSGALLHIWLIHELLLSIPKYCFCPPFLLTPPNCLIHICCECNAH